MTHEAYCSILPHTAYSAQLERCSLILYTAFTVYHRTWSPQYIAPGDAGKPCFFYDLTLVGQV